MKSFRDLEVWQRARSLVREVYTAISASPPFGRDWGLRDQTQRAAVSIAANIAEGHDRFSNKEFARFLDIALGSAAELYTLLTVAADVGHLSIQKAEALCSEVDTLRHMLLSLKRSVQNNR